MSLRPRFGDGGRLMLPSGLQGIRAGGWWRAGDLVGTYSPDSDIDPFERTNADLLVAEDFARAELGDWDSASEWMGANGVADLAWLFADETWPSARDERMLEGWFRDDPHDVLDQQRSVAWVLLSLARLSQDEAVWDRDWMEVVVKGGGGKLTSEPRRSDRLGFIPWGDPDTIEEGAQVWVPADVWSSEIEPRSIPSLPPDEENVPLTTNRSGHIELLRLIIEPYIRIAGLATTDVRWLRADLPIVVREQRRWRSVLCPIFLQLLEGLRRVTEGQSGAAFCRECGRPFLTLDSRRSSFCNDRERFRFTQRERRKRKDRERAALDEITAQDSSGGSGKARSR